MNAFVLIAAASLASTAAAPLTLDLSGLRGRPPAPLEMPPVEPNATEITATTYSVRKGDTVRSVGNATGVGGNALIRVNNLREPYTLHVGQTLIVPGGRYHYVGKGQTGVAIARAYAVSWRSIVDANGVSEPFELRVGQRLVLPEAKSRAKRVQRSAEQRAAAFKIDIYDILTGTEPAHVRPWAAQDAPTTRAVAASTAATAAPTANPNSFSWPSAGPIVSRFGAQARGQVNQGVDIAASPGAGVHAAARGEVAYVGNGVPGYGGLILVRHDGGWISAYGRVDSAAVSKGTRVAAGQIIGRSGSGSVHFELRRARIAVDPIRYLPSRS